MVHKYPISREEKLKSFEYDLGKFERDITLECYGNDNEQYVRAADGRFPELRLHKTSNFEGKIQVIISSIPFDPEYHFSTNKFIEKHRLAEIIMNYMETRKHNKQEQQLRTMGFL